MKSDEPQESPLYKKGFEVQKEPESAQPDEYLLPRTNRAGRSFLPEAQKSSSISRLMEQQ